MHSAIRSTSSDEPRKASGIVWPEGKDFAFTVFDDTDAATLENVGAVYELLADLGFRTTKSAWIVDGDPNKGTHAGRTCDDPPYLDWLRGLQQENFEIGWHGATWHGLRRGEVIAALERFAHLFGHDPRVGANHSEGEGIYWGSARLSGVHAVLYDVMTARSNRGKYRGHIPGDEFFWGDVCRQRIKYLRNFVFQDVNTLRACPFMPYHDPTRPYVNHWFASSDGKDVARFTRRVSEANQDRLEAEGGACIMYTHFANGFVENGRLDSEFVRLLTRLAAKNGWFVPVSTLLDHLLQPDGHREITRRQRAWLERKWLLEKVFVGTH